MSQVNLLEYLRSRTQLDCDCLDIPDIKRLGPFVDCTSNQADAYYEFRNPERLQLLQESVVYARGVHSRYPTVAFEQLTVEVALVKVSLTIAPLITGALCIMANPMYSTSTSKTVENASRIYQICGDVDQEFDLCRLCIKVAATWEGLQACRLLAAKNIRTLATTCFTLEQAVLAAQVGCIYVSPFVHELKVFFEDDYQDEDPILDICVQAQQYFEKYNYSTRVKACCITSVEEAMQIAGVEALTIGQSLVQKLKDSPLDRSAVEKLSLFRKASSSPKLDIQRLDFIDNESRYRDAYARSRGGQGRVKTQRAIDLFCEYQAKAEAIMRAVYTTGSVPDF